MFDWNDRRDSGQYRLSCACHSCKQWRSVRQYQSKLAVEARREANILRSRAYFLQVEFPK